MHKKEVDREPASFELEAAMDKYDNPGDHLPQALDEKAYKAFTIDRILDEVLKKAYLTAVRAVRPCKTGCEASPHC